MQNSGETRSEPAASPVVSKVPPQRWSWSAVFGAAWPAVLLLTACLAPYLNKAFTVDDPWFLEQSRQVLRQPLHPTAFEICWFGNLSCGPSWRIGARQALWGYALAPVAALGNHEWMAHAFQILLAAVAVLFTTALVLRFGWGRREAMLAALILVATPPFLPMASTAMPDTLTVCLVAIGLERLVAFKWHRRWHQALAAGLALGLAPHGRAHLALLLPIAALLLFDRFSLDGIRRGLREFPARWLPIFLAGAVFAAMLLLTREPGAGFAPPGEQVQFAFWRQNLLSFFGYLAFPLPVALAVWLAHRQDRRLWTAGTLVAGALVGFRLLSGHAAFGASMSSLILAGAGMVALALLFFDSLRSGDVPLLCWALVILVPFSAVPYFQVPIRYYLCALPAIVLVVLEMSRSMARFRAAAAAVLLIAAGTLYSSIVLWADAKFAELNRAAAAKLIAPHVTAGEKVWFGGQWGFYWYAQRAGGQAVNPRGELPAPGDLVAVDMTNGGHLTGGHATLALFPHRSLVEALTYPSHWGSSVGLYSNVLATQLWSWKSDRAGRYELWRID